MLNVSDWQKLQEWAYQNEEGFGGTTPTEILDMLTGWWAMRYGTSFAEAAREIRRQLMDRINNQYGPKEGQGWGTELAYADALKTNKILGGE